MNEIEANRICNTAISALAHGEGQLASFPGLLRRIIEEKAWQRRRVPGKGLVEMKSLRDLVTSKPIIGWGEDPKKIEAVIKDDVEVLALWREEMKHQGERVDLCSNPTEVSKIDRGKAYTVSRLQRESPELFEKVKAGELSANAAAIQAGFRKKKTPLDNLRSAWGKASEEERETFLQEVAA